MTNNGPFHKIAEKWKYLCNCLLHCKMASPCNHETHRRKWYVILSLCCKEIIVFILSAPDSCPRETHSRFKVSCLQFIVYNMLVNCSMLFKLITKKYLWKQGWCPHFRSTHIYLKVSSKTPCAGLDSLILSQGGKRTEKTVQYWKQCALGNS